MKRFLLCSLLVLALVPGMALATLTSEILGHNFDGPAPTPPPTNGVVTWGVSGVPIDCIAIGLIDGSPQPFAAPNVITNINPASWSQAWGSPNAAVAGGPASNSITMEINFLGPFQEGAGWDWAAYHNGNFLANGSWQFVNGNFTPGQSDFGIDGKPVPEPATWIALIAGIGVLGVVRMRG